MQHVGAARSMPVTEEQWETGVIRGTRHTGRGVAVGGVRVTVGVGPSGGLLQAPRAAAGDAVQADLLGLAHLAAPLQVPAAALPVAAHCEAVARRLCRTHTVLTGGNIS